MTITSSPVSTRARRPASDAISRLVVTHERLEATIAARRARGLPVEDLWTTMVGVEDALRDISPRSHSHWLAVWATRTPAT